MIIAILGTVLMGTAMGEVIMNEGKDNYMCLIVHA